MKKNYQILFVLITLLFTTVTMNAADFFNSTQMTKMKASDPTPTESFYTSVSLPFLPVDSVDMSDATVAPSMYLESIGRSYPTIGYKFSLDQASTVTINGVSNTISANNIAFIISTSVSFNSYVVLKTQSQFSASLAIGDYYFVIITNNLYGKVKLSITQDVSTKTDDIQTDKILVTGDKGSIHISGIDNQSVVSVYNVTGALIKKLVTSSSTEEIMVETKGLYIVNVNGISKKVIVM